VVPVDILAILTDAPFLTVWSWRPHRLASVANGGANGGWREPPVSGPDWLSWPLAGLMIICALYHGGRLATAGRHEGVVSYDIDLAHLVMGTAMAAMLVVTFGAHVATAWAVLVGIPTLWFILRAGRSLVAGDLTAATVPGQQVLMCASMLFMLVVAGSFASTPSSTATGGMDMPGMTADGQVSHIMIGSRWLVAVTSLVCVSLLVIVAAQHARRLREATASGRMWPLPARAGRPQRRAELLHAPALSLGTQLAMSATMIYLLILVV
jgi:hypothetical protein